MTGQSDKSAISFSATDDLEFAAEKEPWAVYLLENGMKVRTRFPLVSVQPVPGQFTDDGFPVYRVDCMPTINIVYTPEMTDEAKRRRGG